MFTLIKRAVGKQLDRVLDARGLKITPKQHNWADTTEFLPFKETLVEAEREKLSVGDYIDKKHNVAGSTEATHIGLAKLGVYSDQVRSLCEIGPGSGRYLERAIKACNPAHVEIYETAQPWAEWLAKNFNLTLRKSDGRTLSGTASGSIDLIQAHKVFVATQLLTTCSYFREMFRVVRKGGLAVFDVMTEECIDGTNLDAWIASKNMWNSPYPAIMPKSFVQRLFQNQGFTFVGSVFDPMKPGRTECMVFRRKH